MTSFKLDTTLLKDNIFEYVKYRNGLNEDLATIYNTLGYTDGAWNDDDTPVFIEALKRDKYNIAEYIENLNLIYRQLNNLRNGIGDIMASYNYNRDSLLNYSDANYEACYNKIKNAYDYLNRALYYVDCCDFSYGFSKMYKVSELRDEIGRVKERLVYLANCLINFKKSVDRVLSDTKYGIAKVGTFDLDAKPLSYTWNLADVSVIRQEIEKQEEYQTREVVGKTNKDDLELVSPSLNQESADKVSLDNESKEVEGFVDNATLYGTKSTETDVTNGVDEELVNGATLYGQKNEEVDTAIGELNNVQNVVNGVNTVSTNADITSGTNEENVNGATLYGQKDEKIDTAIGELNNVQNVVNGVNTVSTNADIIGGAIGGGVAEAVLYRNNGEIVNSTADSLNNIVGTNTVNNVDTVSAEVNMVNGTNENRVSSASSYEDENSGVISTGTQETKATNAVESTDATEGTLGVNQSQNGELTEGITTNEDENSGVISTGTQETGATNAVESTDATEGSLGVNQSQNGEPTEGITTNEDENSGVISTGTQETGATNAVESTDTTDSSIDYGNVDNNGSLENITSYDDVQRRMNINYPDYNSQMHDVDVFNTNKDFR